VRKVGSNWHSVVFLYKAEDYLCNLFKTFTPVGSVPMNEAVILALFLCSLIVPESPPSLHQAVQLKVSKVE